MIPRSVTTRRSRSVESSARDGREASSAGPAVSAATAANISALRATMAQNVVRQPYVCPSQVPSGAPSTVARFQPAETTAIA